MGASEPQAYIVISRGRLVGLSFELDRMLRVLSIAREELAFRFLAEEDWLTLGGFMYGRAAKYARGSQHNESGLFAFEREAIAGAFPTPPASILVGACGGGRELFGLVERGYRIAAAYDPVSSFIEALRNDPRLFEFRDRLCVGSHQALETMPPIDELRRREEPIDAVIIGWGSYTHLMRAELRVELLRTLRALCPRGPVLLSFFVKTGDEAERPRQLRAQLRRFLRTTREMVEAGDALHRGTGGVHYFTEAAIASEAARAGYRVQHFQEHDFAAAHAILVPDSPDDRP